MNPFWTLWIVTAVMVAIAVHLCLRGLAGPPGSRQLVTSARILPGLLVALLGSLVLRVFDCVVVPCVILAVAATAAVAYAVWSAVEPVRRRCS